MPKYTQEQFDAEIKKRGHGRFVRLGSFARDVPIKFKCIEHQEVFLHKATKVLHDLGIAGKGTTHSLGCTKCKEASKLRQAPNGRFKTSKENWINLLKKEGSKLKFVDTEWRGIYQPHLHYCPDHNETWSTVPKHLSRPLSKAGCRKCRTDAMLKGQGKLKEAFIGNRKVSVQGFEPYAIDYLLSYMAASRLVVESEGKVPVIEYQFKGKQCRHYPDIYDRKIKQLIEVKGPQTFGFWNSFYFSQLKAKRKAAIQQGYKYKVMVFDSYGNRIKIPLDWHSQTFVEIQTWVNTQREINKLVNNNMQNFKRSSQWRA